MLGQGVRHIMSIRTLLYSMYKCFIFMHERGHVHVTYTENFPHPHRCRNQGGTMLHNAFLKIMAPVFRPFEYYGGSYIEVVKGHKLFML